MTRGEEEAARLNRPGHSAEFIGARPQSSKTIKIDLDDPIHGEKAPVFNFTPKKQEEKQEWDYTNEDGHGVSVKAADYTQDELNFRGREHREQEVLEKSGLHEKDLILNMDDISEEEREEINLHNSEAVHGLKIDAKKMEFVREKKEDSEQFIRMKEMAAERKRPKSSLTVDPNFHYKKRNR
tara:strand:- start:1235 stop:1780 length:546 start_codon:yes stop_codon:yes gene_type:complete